MTPEERQLIPLVAKCGCVDLKALREAIERVKENKNNKNPLLGSMPHERQIIYFYEQITDPHGDVVMID